MKCPNCKKEISRSALAKEFGDAKKGGTARMKALSKEERSRMGREAVRKRWDRKKAE